MAKHLTRRQFNRSLAIGGVGLATACSLRSSFDTVIENATVIDGNLNAPFKSDVGIRDGMIKALGDLKNASAARRIDASGLVLSPGFIDIHTHTDLELLADTGALSKVTQGITTEVAGNCGSSPFPLSEVERADLDRHYLEKYGVPVTWTDLDGFLSAIEKAGTAVNYATLTGHGDLRAFGVGKYDVPAGTEGMKAMKMALELSMDQGSFGLSTGLEYSPGSYADTSELIELCKVVAARGGLYATHMRNEDDRVEEALEEAILISRESGVDLEVSHLKACNRKNWHKVPGLLNMIDEAAASGISIHADRYPYIAYGTDLNAFLPLWSRQGDVQDLTAKLKNDAEFENMRPYIVSRGENIGGWDRVVISDVTKEQLRFLEGKSIADYASEVKLHPVDAVRQLLLEDNTTTGIIGFAMDEDNLRRILSHPLVMPGSDGNAVNPKGPTGIGKPHPRYYGSFPRYLGKYAVREKLFDLKTAVYKMSGLPASKLGLSGRGIIREGFHADLVLFDPETVIDRAAFTDPHRFSAGIEWVFVNGAAAVEYGKPTETRAGKVLRA